MASNPADDDPTLGGRRPADMIWPARKPGELFQPEVFWRDHCTWLEGSGYTLRPRYHPEWVPSWTNTSKSWATAEDGQPPLVVYLLDATRKSDGAMVMLKRVLKQYHPYEAEIGTYLSSEPLISDSHNHCMRVYEVLHPPQDDNSIILVLAFLRKFDDPPFDTIGEALDFFGQALEGLHFMHSHHIAHRDCTAKNIMMDPLPLYPNLYHPVDTRRTRDYTGIVKPFSRTEHPTRYYLIDFGLSRRYQPEDLPVLEDIIMPGDKTVPEYQGDAEACDPFPVDVYLIGNMIREKFLRAYFGYDFMRTLVQDMVQDDPTKRPPMDEVITRFNAIRASLSSSKLRSRPVGRREFFVAAFLRYIPHTKRRIMYMYHGVPPIPSPSI